MFGLTYVRSVPYPSHAPPVRPPPLCRRLRGRSMGRRYRLILHITACFVQQHPADARDGEICVDQDFTLPRLDGDLLEKHAVLLNDDLGTRFETVLIQKSPHIALPARYFARAIEPHVGGVAVYRRRMAIDAEAAAIRG